MLKESIRQFANNFILFQAKNRGFFWKLFIKSCGTNFQVMHNCRILGPGTVTIGNSVYINHNVDIYGQGGVEIGDFCLIGPNSNILSIDHSYDNWKLPIGAQGVRLKKVIIEEDVWICANVTVLPGVKIGKGSIIAANSVVTKNVDPYSIMGGVPAKLIKKRFGKKILKELLVKKHIK